MSVFNKLLCNEYKFLCLFTKKKKREEKKMSLMPSFMISPEELLFYHMIKSFLMRYFLSHHMLRNKVHISEKSV